MESSWKTCSEGKTKAEPAATNGKMLENFMISDGDEVAKQRERREMLAKVIVMPRMMCTPFCSSSARQCRDR
jgi:hypothetical protein